MLWIAYAALAILAAGLALWVALRRRRRDGRVGTGAQRRIRAGLPVGVLRAFTASTRASSRIFAPMRAQTLSISRPAGSVTIPVAASTACPDGLRAYRECFA